MTSGRHEIKRQVASAPTAARGFANPWRLSPPPDNLGLVRARWQLLFAVAGLAACRVFPSGVTFPPPPDGSSGWDGGVDGARSIDTVDSTLVVVPLDTAQAVDLSIALISVRGTGCSDGTREGFRDLNQKDIAGCAGAWDVPGILNAVPNCGRSAGNDGLMATGIGCSAADLCAEGWHICRDGSEVRQSSTTQSCEGCLSGEELVLFIVATGSAVGGVEQDASPMADAPLPSSIGLCGTDYPRTNDVHGCGTLGTPDTELCAPLLRRMSFVDCLGTAGIWMCGDYRDSLREAEVVRKTAPELGGVLCCRG
jgi:hypothetical protein